MPDNKAKLRGDKISSSPPSRLDENRHFKAVVVFIALGSLFVGVKFDDEFVLSDLELAPKHRISGFGTILETDGVADDADGIAANQGIGRDIAFGAVAEDKE